MCRDCLGVALGEGWQLLGPVQGSHVGRRRGVQRTDPGGAAAAAARAV